MVLLGAWLGAAACARGGEDRPGGDSIDPLAAAAFMASEWSLQRAERWSVVRTRGGVPIEVPDLDNYDRVMSRENELAELLLAELPKATTHRDSLRIKYGLQFEPRRGAINETHVNPDHFPEVEVMVDTLLTERAAAAGKAPGAGTLWAKQPAAVRAELAKRAPRLDSLRTRHRELAAVGEKIPGPRQD